MSLDGWTVRDDDDDDHVYQFNDFTLDPGATVTLHTGKGTDTETHVYWGESQAVWNNGGDTIIVRSDDGEEVITYTYPEQDECETTNP